MTAKKSSSRFHYGYLIVIALCMLCLGPTTLSFNTAGIFFDPVSTELGVGKGQFGFYMTLQYLAMTISMPFAGKILAKYDARIVLTTCVLFVSGSLVAMSQFSALYQFYIAGCFIGSANSILLYLMVPTIIDRWFKKKVGLFVGLCLAFTGIGGIILNPFAGYLIENFGWRTGYLTEGIIAAVISLPFTLFIVRSFPSDKGIKPYGDSGKMIKEKVSGISMRQALKTPALYALALYAGLMDVGITLNYYIPSYVSSLGYSVTLAATIASAVMIGQMFGKVVLGYLNDKSVMIGMSSAVFSGIIGIGAMIVLGGKLTAALYAGAVVFGIFFAGCTVTTSLMTRDVFGSLDYSQIFSVVAMIASFCAAFSSAIWGFMIDTTRSYTITFGVGILLMFVCFIIGWTSLILGKKLRRKYAKLTKISHEQEGNVENF